MKQIVFFLLSALPLISFAQTSSVSNENNPFDLPVDSITDKITFVKVIEAKNKSKSEIYSNVKNWITENYKSPKDVINIDDKETGVILLKSFFSHNEVIGDLHLHGTQHFYFSLRVNIKDKKFKITITDLEHDMVFEEQPVEPEKSSLESALLINKNSGDYKKYFEARKEMADVINKEIERIISSIEHYNTDF